MRVLVVDDDTSLLENVRSWLTGSGIAVDVAHTARDGLVAAATGSFEAVVLDVMLGVGDDDGYDVCRLLRGSGIGTPILMLTSRDGVSDRVHGRGVGADDYLVKPFALEELEARLRALSRRHLSDRSAVLRAGDVVLDTSRRLVTVRGVHVRLTAKEVALLEHLIHHRNGAEPQDAIFAAVWGFAEAPSSNLVDVYVGRLRRKLAAAGSSVTVLSLKRQGYILSVVSPTAGDGGASE